MFTAKDLCPVSVFRDHYNTLIVMVHQIMHSNELTSNLGKFCTGYEPSVAGEWDDFSRYVVDGMEVPSPVSHR